MINRSHVMCSMKDRNVEHVAKCSSHRMRFCVDKDVTWAMEWEKILKGRIFRTSLAQRSNVSIKCMLESCILVTFYVD